MDKNKNKVQVVCSKEQFDQIMTYDAVSWETYAKIDNFFRRDLVPMETALLRVNPFAFVNRIDS